ERAFDTWTEALRHYRGQPYDKILPGHGAPGGKELYDQMEAYLSIAQTLLAKSSDGDDLKVRLLASFPALGGRTLLDHKKRFLFPPERIGKYEGRDYFVWVISDGVFSRGPGIGAVQDRPGDVRGPAGDR